MNFERTFNDNPCLLFLTVLMRIHIKNYILSSAQMGPVCLDRLPITDEAQSRPRELGQAHVLLQAMGYIVPLKGYIIPLKGL